MIASAWLVLALLTVVCLIGHGYSEAGLRAGIRASAKLGACFFLLAFTASSINSLFKNHLGKWLMRNRRHLGVAFAILHFGHLALIIALASEHTDSFFATTAISSIVGGGVAYLWLLAMTVTSFQGPTQALGRRNWTRLHKSGVYVLWGIFTASYLPMMNRGPIYLALVLALIAGYLLRVAAFVKRRERKRA